jgi:hypothetical protein
LGSYQKENMNAELQMWAPGGRGRVGFLELVGGLGGGLQCSRGGEVVLPGIAMLTV